MPRRPYDGLVLSRRSLLTAAAAGTLLALAGCSASGRTEVRFHTSKPESIPYFRDLVARYNASQTRVAVRLETATNLQAGFLRGDPPDIGLLNYNYEMARFMERGALSDLSDMPSASRIRPDVLDLADQYATYPGRTSVLPFSVAAAAVVYNVELFAEVGVDVPTTWTELITTCDAFQAAGVSPFYGTFRDDWTIAQGLYDYSIGGAIDTPAFFAAVRELGADLSPDSATSFTRDIAPPLEQMLQLLPYHQGDADSRGYGDGNAAMGRSEAAMYLQGPWSLGEIAKTDPELRLGAFPLPMTDDPGDRKVRTNLDLAFWIPEASRVQDEARDFVEYVMQVDEMDAFNAQFLGFGTTTDAAGVTDPRIQELQEFYDAGAFYLGASQLVPRQIPIYGYAQGIVLGADATATMRTVDADWARLAFRS